MPTIFEPRDLPVTRKDGAHIATLANHAMLGTNALQVERIEVEAAAQSSFFGAVDAERFVYVIRGSGRASVGEQEYPLEAESVLWLEKSDTFYLEAGANGLEVLLCRAPAGDEGKYAD
jgi:quercetin dioxygenase-like cupin family protein